MRFFTIPLLVAATSALPSSEVAFKAYKRSLDDAPILDARINAHQAEGRSVNLSPQNNNLMGLLPRQCEYGCSCATGLNPGLYCGYCTSPRKAIPGCTQGECLDSRLDVLVDPVTHNGGDERVVESVMAGLRKTVAVFEYLDDTNVVTELVADIRRRLVVLEGLFTGAQGIVDHWDESYPHYFAQVSQFARDYLFARIRYVRSEYAAIGIPFRDWVISEVDYIESRIPECFYPFEKPRSKYTG
ncbi:hypothetical protein QBC34DRAFT_420150 [Podospora aff. communis PSN243]|uniref:Uncharacterized protein n=1 Tax=Podospora aff. communis PSN243 TaxID=3040156 RepID=A0AAV9H3P9_9PEZI|nr:hypothetical protein QBC34DRAFT_420150 [Podospora aff. communis PSN243]